MDFLTKTYSKVEKKRIEQIQRYTQYAEIIQFDELKKILEEAKNTLWGIKYDFNSITNYRVFCERIPLQSYDDLKPYISRMIAGEKDILCPGVVKWYAQSSGTTNDKSKYIPVSNEILKRCHYQGGADTTSLYIANNSDTTRFFSGKHLILGGSHSPSAINENSHCGDLSAVLLENMNPIVNLFRVPDKKIILMNEWEEKLKAIIENTYQKDVVSLSGVPSWMLVLIKGILEKTKSNNLLEVWPNLEVFIHGGISFTPYRKQYEQLIPSDQMKYMETYNASEGFFGIQSNPADHSMLLMLDYGLFYEFIPMKEFGSDNPTVLSLGDISVGVNYAMLITTVGGLWRYEIGDTIRFTQTHPYKFVITGRTKHFINAFGEELMVANADKALAATCLELNVKIKEYTAAPLFLLEKGKGCHQWLIEFEQTPDDLEAFRDLLDEHLKDLNSDYEAKRYKEISLQKPEIIVAKPNLFYDWLEKKGKLGGQHKIPRLSNNRDHIESLLILNKKK